MKAVVFSPGSTGKMRKIESRATLYEGHSIFIIQYWENKKN